MQHCRKQKGDGMISLRRTMTWPRRRWRAKGFGIHSPFAFSFVTEVLARRGCGGIDEELRAAATGDGFGDMALIYRCISHFRPGKIAIYPAGDEILTRIVGLTAPDAEIISGNSTITPDMAIVRTPEAAPTHDNGAPVYIIRNIDRAPAKDLWKRLTSGCSRGMDFSDRRTGIICRFSHLPRQSFKIAFK